MQISPENRGHPGLSSLFHPQGTFETGVNLADSLVFRFLDDSVPFSLSLATRRNGLFRASRGRVCFSSTALRQFPLAAGRAIVV